MSLAILMVIISAAAGAAAMALILKLGVWKEEEQRWTEREEQAAALAYHQVTTANPGWVIVAHFDKRTPQSSNVQVTLDTMPPALKLTAAVFIKQLRELAPTPLVQVTIQRQKHVPEQ